MFSFILPPFYHVRFSTVGFFVRLSSSQKLQQHIQIVIVTLCISNTDKLLENVKARFWFTMKNPVEILLTSDLTQHSSSFELASLWTQELVGTSNVGQDTLSHFLYVSLTLLLSLFLSTFRRFHSSTQCYTFEKKGYVLDVKACYAGRIPPSEGTAI